MRVLLLLPYAWDTVPGQRYRIEQWHPWLESHGVQFTIRSLLDKADQQLLYSTASSIKKGRMLAGCMARRVMQLGGLRDIDVIWLYRAAWPIGPAVVERLLRATGKPIIYEFDDAIFLPDTAAVNRRWSFLKFAQKTDAICKLASHIVVGNHYLAQYAHEHSQHVTVIPTTIDTEKYYPRSHYESSTPITIGWTGSPTTARHLGLLDSVLRRVSQMENIAVRVIGVPDYKIEGVDVTALQWHPARQVSELHKFDIGVMPLPDEEWVNGKCACKALEYMAVGVPPVCSPYGVNSQVVEDGKNGLLARTEDEWVEKLLTLVRDVRLRERLGRAARGTVESEYAADVQAPRVLELLRHVASTASGKQPQVTGRPESR